jgi:hypothetical protein
VSADNWAVCPRCLSTDEHGYGTLREDYEFYGAESGTVNIDYSCSCRNCSLSFGFQEQRTFWSAS